MGRFLTILKIGVLLKLDQRNDDLTIFWNCNLWVMSYDYNT
jgi:hypothetical protein